MRAENSLHPLEGIFSYQFALEKKNRKKEVQIRFLSIYYSPFRKTKAKKENVSICNNSFPNLPSLFSKF